MYTFEFVASQHLQLVVKGKVAILKEEVVIGQEIQPLGEDIGMISQKKDSTCHDTQHCIISEREALL